MPSFVSQNWLNGMTSGTRTVASGNFYLSLVTAEPAPTVNTLADCTLASGGSLNATASVALANRQIQVIGGISTLTFDNPAFSNFFAGAATPITGAVLVNQVGGSPATSDPVVAYLESVTNPAPTVANCSTTNASATVTTSGTFPTGIEGRAITGTGIPADTIVLDRVSATEIRISRDATVTGTATLTVNTAAPYTPPTTVGGAVTTFTPSFVSSGAFRLVA